LFELKVDGFRALAYVDDGHCELMSRRRNPYKSFKDLQSSLANLKVKNAVIDGEIACVDEEGRSIFNELLFRRGCPIFYAFDLLYLNDHDLRQLPLTQRAVQPRAIVLLWAGAVRTIQEKTHAKGVALVNAELQRHDPKARTIKKIEDFQYIREETLLLVAEGVGVLDKTT
jgi:ATP-dependent DNA ligase